MRQSRRIYSFVAGIVTAAIGVAAYAFAIEPHWLRIRRYVVGIPDLCKSLDGLKIVFLSDFHLSGPGHNRKNTVRAIEIARSEQPDLLLLGGDYFDDGKPDDDRTVYDTLSDFSRVFAVLGNHDYRKGDGVAQSIQEILENRGVCVLRNETVSIHLRDVDVLIAGLDDPYTRRDNLTETLASWPADADRALILLSHSPVIADRLPMGCAQLVLSGHTHGGQIRLSPSNKTTPLDYSWYADQIHDRPMSPYIRGFHWVRGNLLYVSNGLGMSRLPLRFMARPEVIILSLSIQEQQAPAACDSPLRYVREVY